MWVSAAAYAALSVGVIEIAEAVSNALLFPAWTTRLVTFLLILGFPIVLVMAWMFDITAEGLRRTEASGVTDAEGARTTSGPSLRISSREMAAGQPTRRGAGLGARTLPIPDSEPRRRPRRQPADLEAAPPDPDRVKRAALAHVRHELRTPINAILGYSEMLIEDETDPALTEDLRKIHGSGRRLLTLVDAILDPDKLEGSIERDIESFGAQIQADLRTPINTVVGYCELLIENLREEQRTELVPDLERILGAARGLLETSGDIVRVATTEPTGARLEGRLADSSELAREVLAKIRPVEAGEAAERSEGQGSLLVVDDNATNRDLLTRQLARQGYIAAAAADGGEALRMMSRQDFDLILLDVIMPGLDGVETLRRIRSDERLQEIPVIMLSSLDEVDSAVRCIELGANEYVTKPIQSSLLQARIGANLEVRRMRARERAYRERIEADAALIEELLYSAFPPAVAERVRAGEKRFVEPIAETTVVYWRADPGAHPGASGLADYVSRLADLLAEFEQLASTHGIEIRLGRRDGFVAAVAGPSDPGRTGPEALAGLALALCQIGGREKQALSLSGGLHTGAAVAGLIGGDRLHYDLWGDAVDTARAIAERAPAGTVLVSPTAHALLREACTFEVHGVSDIPGAGQMRTYLLKGLSAGPGIV